VTTSVWVVPFVVLGGLLLTVAWVFQDATSHLEHGERVEATIGALRLDSPSAWAAGCLVLWVFFFPLYLRARST
jgi:fructose-specific phosphotransferase system IIC component